MSSFLRFSIWKVVSFRYFDLAVVRLRIIRYCSCFNKANWETMLNMFLPCQRVSSNWKSGLPSLLSRDYLRYFIFLRCSPYRIQKTASFRKLIPCWNIHWTNSKTYIYLLALQGFLGSYSFSFIPFYQPHPSYQMKLSLGTFLETTIHYSKDKFPSPYLPHLIPYSKKQFNGYIYFLKRTVL